MSEGFRISPISTQKGGLFVSTDNYLTLMTLIGLKKESDLLMLPLLLCFLERRRVYDKQGRSKKWKAMKAASDDLCRTRCRIFVNRQG